MYMKITLPLLCNRIFSHKWSSYRSTLLWFVNQFSSCTVLFYHQVSILERLPFIRLLIWIVFKRPLLNISIINHFGLAWKAKIREMHNLSMCKWRIILQYCNCSIKVILFSCTWWGRLISSTRHPLPNDQYYKSYSEKPLLNNSINNHCCLTVLLGSLR